MPIRKEFTIPLHISNIHGTDSEINLIFYKKVDASCNVCVTDVNKLLYSKLSIIIPKTSK